MFSSKTIASSAAVLVLEKPNFSNKVSATLQVDLLRALKPQHRFLKPEILRFISQFNFNKYQITELNSETYSRLFHLWDHPTSSDGFTVFLEKHLISQEKTSFSFLEYLPLFSLTVSKMSETPTHSYRNPNQEYFEDLMKSKDIKFIFRSVLNVHNHFDADKKLNYQVRIEEYAETYDHEKVSTLYRFDEKKQKNILELQNNAKYKKLLSQPALMDSDRATRGKIAKTLAEIVYSDRGTAALVKMIQYYDKYFSAYFNPRDFVILGVGRSVAEMVADLEIDESKQAIDLKKAAEDLWLNSNEEYRRQWLNYFYQKYPVNPNNTDLEGSVLTIMIAWFRKKIEELKAQQISDNF